MYIYGAAYTLERMVYYTCKTNDALSIGDYSYNRIMYYFNKEVECLYIRSPCTKIAP